MGQSTQSRREKRLEEAEGYLGLEMPRHALTALDAIENDPDAADTFRLEFLRGQAFRALELYDEALAALNRAFTSNPENVDLLMAMAWCFKRTNQLPRAITAMEQAYRLTPKEAVILYNLSCYWSLAGNKTQALSWLGRALRMDASFRKLISEETDFDPLRDDPDFQLVARPPDETQPPA